MMPEALLKSIGTEARARGVPIISDEAADILRVLVKTKKPYRILELGTAVGYSAILMKEAAPPCCVIDTVENDYERVLEARKNVLEAGYGESINIIFGDAREVLGGLRTKYDLIFFDAAKNQYIDYLELAIPLFAEGALLAADNIFYKGLVIKDGLPVRKHRTAVLSLRRFIERLSLDKHFTTAITRCADGFAIAVYMGGGI